MSPKLLNERNPRNRHTILMNKHPKAMCSIGDLQNASPLKKHLHSNPPLGILTGKILGLLLVSLLIAGGAADAGEEPNLTVSDLNVKNNGKATQIQVRTSSPPNFLVSKLEHPSRLTIDISEARFQGIEQLTDVKGGAVSQIAATQFNIKGRPVARLMINFKYPSHYSVRTEGDLLVVKINPQISAPKEPQGLEAARRFVRQNQRALRRAQKGKQHHARLKKSASRRTRSSAKAARAKQQREAHLSAELKRVQSELEKQRDLAKAAVEAATRLREAALQARLRLARLSGEERAKAKAKIGIMEKRLRRLEAAYKDAQRKGQNLQSKIKQAKEKTAPVLIKDIRFVDAKPSANVEILCQGELRHQVIEEKDGPVLILKGAKLPRILERTLDASEFDGPLQLISSYNLDQGLPTVKVKVKTRQSHVPHRLRQDKNTLVWEFSKDQQVKSRNRFASNRSHSEKSSYTYQSPQVAAARTKNKNRKFRRYSGQRIDLDFKDADIHNILRLLSDVGNVNIVTADNVTGKVTIRMKNVPWDHALDVILRAKGYGQVREGNLIRVAPATDLEKEREAEIARLNQITMLKPLETRLIPLSYAQAGDVMPQLQYTMSPRGKMTFDMRTNMLIARDLTANLDLMEKMLKNLDTQTPQVLIEARIVEARVNFSKDIGIQWGGAFTASSANGNSTGLVFPNQFGIGGGTTDGKTPTEGLLLGQATNPNFAVNLPAAGVGTGSGGAIGMTFGSISGNVNINLRLSAAEGMGDIRIISSPKITTLDNVDASIMQGVTIPYSQVSADGVQTTFKNATLNLQVKPHVTADGSVIMKVQVSNDEPDFANTGPGGAPTILTKQAQTELLVKDGDTTVIGGIYSTRTGTTLAKVPWFADIPILGYLFRQRKNISDRQEVLVFITPRIINRAQSVVGMGHE